MEQLKTRRRAIRQGVFLVVIFGGILLLGACSFFGLGGSNLSQEDIRATAAVLAGTRVMQTGVVIDTSDGGSSDPIGPTPTLNMEGCFDEDLFMVYRGTSLPCAAAREDVWFRGAGAWLLQ